MISRRAARAIALVVAGLALIATAAGLVAVLGPASSSRVLSSASQVSGPATALIVVAAVSLLVAGGTAWFGVSHRWLACVAFAASAAWLAPELTGNLAVTREARTLGMVLSPLLAPLVAHLSVGSIGARTTIVGRWALIAAYAVAIVATIGRAATYDPFFDLDCAPVCVRGDNALLASVNVELAKRLGTLGWLATLVTGAGLAAWSAARLLRADRRARRREWPVLVPAVVCGIALVWTAIARLTSGNAGPADAALLAPMLTLALALAWLGGGATASLVAEFQRGQQLLRLAEAPDSAGALSLRSILARSLDDDTVRICYPLQADAGFVDELGRSVPDPHGVPGRQVAAIERNGELVALVDHATALDPHVLTDEIGAAARLAVDNERLGAVVRAHLRQLRQSRERIVAAGDAARGRIERDLHDGAQQRLLAVSYELRVARGVASVAAGRELLGQVDAAISDVDGSLRDLRALAHGIYPAILGESGLAAALRTLAGRAKVPMTVADHSVGRCLPSAEAAAYFTVTEAIRTVDVMGAKRISVSLDSDGEALTLELRSDVRLDAPVWLRAEDRVAAAGGTLSVQRDGPPAGPDDHSARVDVPAPSARLIVTLPCA